VEIAQWKLNIDEHRRPRRHEITKKTWTGLLRVFASSWLPCNGTLQIEERGRAFQSAI
jgi:hypothetical protein